MRHALRSFGSKGRSRQHRRCALLPELAEAGVTQGILRVMPLTEVPTYIRKLRRDLPSYLFRVIDERRRDEADYFLFWSNYKGSTDFFTKYVYPPPRGA